MKKFELTSESITFLGRKLFRIRALVEFGDVEAGELGGYIEKEDNLDHGGNAWVYDNAKVCGNAEVCDDAWVYDNAKVCGNAKVYGNAKVCDDAWVYDNAKVYDNAMVCGNAKVYGNAEVCGNAKVCGNVMVCGNAWVYDNAEVCGNARVCGDARVCDNAMVCGNAGYACTNGFGSVNRTTTFFRLKDGGVGVKCGCFYGTLQEFRDKVRETHGESAIAEEYLDLAALMEKRFRRTENEQKTEEEK